MNKIAYSRYTPFVLYSLLGVYFLFSIFFIRPGFFLPDSTFEYSEFLTGKYIDWHPPMMNIWWSVFENINAPFVVHLSLYCLGIYVYLSTFFKENQYVKAILFFIILMNPLFSFSMLNLLKDMGMLASLLFISALLYKYSRDQISLKLSIIIISPVILYTFGIRQNALFAIFPLIFFLFLSKKQDMKLFAMTKYFVYTLIVSIILFVVNNIITYKLYDAKKMYPQSIAMRYDLAAIECLSNHKYKIPDALFAQPDDEEKNREKLCTLFTYKTSDTLFWWTPKNTLPPFAGRVSDAQYNILKSEWMQTLPSNLLYYLEFRSQVFAYAFKYNVWYLGPSVSICTSELPFQLKYQKIYNSEHDFNISIVNPVVYNAMNNIYMRLASFINHFFGLIIMVLNLTLLINLFLTPKKDRFTVVLLLSGLFYQMMWFFLLPVPDYRYFLWFYASSIIAVFTAIFKKSKQD